MKKLLHLFFILFLTSLFSQQQDIEVLNTSINSQNAEFGITYLNNNSVFFASSKKNDDDKVFKKNRRKNNRQLYLELYQAVILKNGDLIQTNKFSSEINNKIFESDISFTPDGKTIYFTWNNFYNTEKRIDSAKWKTLKIMKADLNENLDISNIKSLPFNSDKYSARNPEVSKNGKQLFFVSDMPNGFGKTDIYVVDILGKNNYSKPKNLGANINTKKSELFPYITKNNTLFFSSYGHKGKGNLDIFKSNLKNGNFQKAKNLPSPFNSKYDDFAFVVNEVKNTGYFTSNRKNGKGDVDIYAFRLKKQKSVCTKVITGLITDIETKKPIDKALVSLYKNTILQETKIIVKDSKYNFKLNCSDNYKIIVKKENYQSIEFKIAPDTKIGYEISKNLELTPIKCAQLIRGKVLNSETNSPVKFTQVSLYQNNILKESKKVTNKFTFDLDCNRSYKIVAEKENFKNAEVIFQTNNTNASETTKILLLKPLEYNQLINGIVLDKETNKPILNALVTIFKDNLLIETFNLNNTANFNSKLDCNSQYKIITTLKNYEKNITKINTSKSNNEILNKTILLKPTIEFITIRKQKMIKTKPIYFDLDKYDIRLDAAIELQKVIDILNKYPKIKLKIKSHTDSRAPDNYNLILSNKRVNSTMNYIISKGINPDRLTGKGYGETQLINKCSNGVKCTQAEHELNRRTEFVIIQE